MTHQTIDATIEPTQDPSKRYRCRHIFIDGHRCGSPSLRGEHFCYYHLMTRGFAEEKRHRRTWTEFELPPLEDRSSILAAITEVLQRIACDRLPTKQAGLLLYGLQIASLNLPETDEAKAKSDNQPPVEQVLINPRYGDLAPEDVDEAPLTPPQSSDPEPTILPNLNASAFIAPVTGTISALQAPAFSTRQMHVISTEGGAFAAVAERPLYFAVALACSPTSTTNPTHHNPITLSNVNAYATTNGATYTSLGRGDLQKTIVARIGG